jgi:TM2 domain-containing membrane protein YozV
MSMGWIIILIILLFVFFISYFIKSENVVKRIVFNKGQVLGEDSNYIICDRC